MMKQSSYPITPWTTPLRTDNWQHLADSVGLLGVSTPHVRLLDELSRVAPKHANVLLVGETGVGKEVYARFIHACDEREGPFVAVNCAAIPDHLFENEMFGHSEGAYTDARSNADGLVAAANGGTLFLDEINRLSFSAQAKTLRLLQEKEYRRLGEASSRSSNFRLICAMNVDPLEEIAARRLRDDLYYRINVVAKKIAPLRQRKEDIYPLIKHFAVRFSNDYKRDHPLEFSSAARIAMYGNDWPGNVRQLIHAVQSLACQLPDRPLQVTTDDLRLIGLDQPEKATHVVPGAGQKGEMSFNDAKRAAIKDFEVQYIRWALERADGNITQAATLAGKHRRAFFELMRKHGIHATDFKRSDGPGRSIISFAD